MIITVIPHVVYPGWWSEVVDHWIYVSNQWTWCCSAKYKSGKCSLRRWSISNYLPNIFPPIGLMDSSWPGVTLTTWVTYLLKSDKQKHCLVIWNTCLVASQQSLPSSQLAITHTSWQLIYMYNILNKKRIVDTNLADEMSALLLNSILTRCKQTTINAI